MENNCSIACTGQLFGEQTNDWGKNKRVSTDKLVWSNDYANFRIKISYRKVDSRNIFVLDSAIPVSEKRHNRIFL
jgi:hypothetical protein